MPGPTPIPPGLVPAFQLAVQAQPYLGATDAAAWLRDMRRGVPGYSRRISKPPRPIKRGNRVFYSSTDAARVVDELRRGTGGSRVPT